ncbi:hypothetical protein GCM10028864_30030 [Microlunatus parietis]
MALRAVQPDGRLKFALAAFELERTDDHVVLYVPVGAPGFNRRGERAGPRGAFLLPDRWEPGLHPRPWRHQDVVMVHRFADEWSTWRWLDDQRDWTPGAYVNLERLWVSRPQTYDTDDLTLDVVVSPGGDVRLKDEDELAWAEAEGIYAPETAAAIRTIGDRALTHFGNGGWPLDAAWDRWRAPSDLGLPSLPDGWDRVP